MSNWGMLTARFNGRAIGGAIIAYRTEGCEMLEGRTDLAVLWDIRVDEGWRGKGVGTKLFVKAEEWARLHECRTLKVETQNINVAACRFYQRRGCELRIANHGAYPECPDEIQLLWYKDIR